MKQIIVDPKSIDLARDARLTENAGFGKVFSPIMIECNYKDGAWGDIHLKPYGSLILDPSTKVLHYGQEIFEGLKAYKNEEGEIYLFRPEKNAARFNFSARRMSMPEFPIKDFINCCSKLTAYSKNLVPKRLGESLYLRPFMIATEVSLGIKPAEEFKFLIIASPVANYFKKPNVKVFVERQDCRATKGGTGAAKTGGNYAASLQSYTKILNKGCDQTMWLDGAEKRYIEEMSGMNFMAVINGELHTPELTDTILHGITRESILELAKTKGIKTVERKMDIDEFLADVKSGACTEAFVCGTASVLTPVNSFLDEKDDQTYLLKDAFGKTSSKLKEELLKIQSGRTQGPDGWSMTVETMDF